MSVREGARDQQASLWRQRHVDVDHNTAWKKSGGDWWKGRSGFKDYDGHHHHHHRFIPDIGYVDESTDCRFDTIEVGVLAPPCATAYGLTDWSSYGLPRPPAGCKWVWLDGSIALVQESDGYVIQILRNVF
ncbi:MAG TPA: RcnB family protein [Caulobacteraceae bacterium]